MNIISGIIESVQVSGQLSLVKINAQGHIFSSIIIDTPATTDYLKANSPIQIIFKETEVIIGTSPMQELSLRNQISGTIAEVERAELLSKVLIETPIGVIRSIITTQAVDDLGLQVGYSATAMIKTNEVMLSTL